MSNRSSALLVASMLIFVTIVPIAIAYDNDPSSIEAEIIGEDAYGNYVLPVTADELFAEGYRYGDYVEMDFGLFDGYGIFLPDISTCHPASWHWWAKAPATSLSSHSTPTSPFTYRWASATTCS